MYVIFPFYTYKYIIYKNTSEQRSPVVVTITLIVTYVKMTPEKAKRVVEEHIKGGKVVAEYTLANENA